MIKHFLLLKVTKSTQSNALLQISNSPLEINKKKNTFNNASY